MDQTTHFVLVHGAGHGAWCWYKVATILKSRGHKVTALDLAACGVSPIQVTQIKSVSDYSQPLMELLMCLPSEERVVVVAHSFGGVCTSIAMERFPHKIAAAVFVTAMMLGTHLSYTAAKDEYSRRIKIDPSISDSRQAFDDGLNKPPTSRLFGPTTMSSCLYQLSPPEDLMLGMMLIRPHPLLSNEVVEKEAKFTEDKHGSVARIYVVCAQDNLVNECLQKWMIQQNPPREVKVIADSDHMVMFSNPQHLCSCLEDIVQKYV